MKLLSQLEHVDSATPLARKLEAKISEGIAQGYSHMELVFSWAAVAYINFAALVRASTSTHRPMAMIKRIKQF